ncbi:MAG TPA: nuclear transport factor 2 family protein [Solirubrobacterales bacterium]|nr:nuclear transport factor 2 family protein [Solirubrobacterales bacterium]
MSTAVREGARTPGESTRALAASISRGDLDGATSCFAKDACLLTPDATVVRGREEIRPILHQMIVAGSKIEVQESSIVLAGEVALGTERWVMSSAGSEGSPFTRALTPTMVLRQVEGVWKLAVAIPWGRR